MPNPRSTLRFISNQLASRNGAPSTDVIDATAHTQQIPITTVGTAAPGVEPRTGLDTHADTTERDTMTVTSDEPMADTSSNTTGNTTGGAATVEPAASNGHEPVVNSVALAHNTALSENLTPAVPDTGETPRTPAVLTSELVSGLRSAGKHLSRPSASEGHLRTELTITARRIEALVRARDAHDEPWALAASSLVHDAACALEQRRITDGWQLVRAAQAEVVEVLSHRDLAVERSVLIGSSHDVIATATDRDTEELRTEVWALRQARNVHSAELERRLFDAARGLFHRGVMLLGVLVLGAFGVLFASPSSDPADALGSLSAYLTIVGLAVTGAAVSHTVFSNESGRASAITEAANPLHIVLLRLAFGGVAGLIVVVLLQADIQNLINVTAISAYPWAIAGGLSERFVDRMIHRLESDAHNAADATHSGER